MKFKEKLLEKIEQLETEYNFDHEICEELSIPKSELSVVQKSLEELVKEGRLIKSKKGKYASISSANLIRGTISGNQKGFAFFIPDDRTLTDLFIAPPNVNGAMHKDKVLVQKIKSNKASNDEGEVVSIIERGYNAIIGVFKESKNFAFVIPDEKKICGDIFIPKNKFNNAKHNDKVVVYNLYHSSSDNENMQGEIKEVLGNKNNKEVDELSIIKTHGLEPNFSEELENLAKKLNKPITKQEMAGRRDFRNDIVITIDGEDARDLDDAIGIEKNNGEYVLTVHIADVSHYVTQNSIIDKEAFNRGTSVYFPKLVIPMLPRELSNGICSLNENVDRLTMTCVIKIDKNGKVKDSEIVEGIIKTRHRMTYTNVFKMIEGDKETIDKYFDVYDKVILMKELAEILIAKRDERGSIDLDMKETKIIMNEKGEVEISERERNIAHKLIEEFMISANEAVAEFISRMDLPFIYRIHEKPSPEKTVNFVEYIKHLGVSVKFKKENLRPMDYQKLLTSLEGTPLHSIVNKVMLRSMQKAKYSPDNLGHFGLASKFYSHFTSPIRRYPDLAIHRILKLVIKGDIYGKEEYLNNFVLEASIQSSLRERKADEAERDMDDLYKCWFMLKYVGESLDGIVSGVTQFGAFVELENSIEGLMRIDKIPPYDFVFKEKEFALVSKRKTFKLGDKVEIIVDNVDMDTRKIEFVLKTV